MRDNSNRSILALAQKVGSLTLRQLAEELPPDSAGRWAAGVLTALTAVPLFVSGTAPLVGIGFYWFRCLLILGFFTGVLTSIRLAQRRDKGFLPVCLALLLCWSVISGLLSSDPVRSFLGDPYRQEGVLTYILYATIFLTALMPTAKQQRFVCEMLAGVCAVIGLLVIIGHNDVFYLDADLRAAMFHHYNHFGYFLALCVPLCFGLALSDEKPSLPRLAEFWLSCNALAFNSTRGAFLAIGAMLALWNLIIPLCHREKWKRLLLLDLVFIATIGFLNTGSTLMERMSALIQQLESVQEAPENTAALDGLGSNRGILWRLGIGYALEKPLFGYGPENLGQLYYAYSPDLSDRPHNELIQIAASLGIPALCFYLTGLGSLLAAFLRRFRAMSIPELAVFASVGGYLVSSLFGNSMYYTTPYFCMMLAFAWSSCQNNLSVV